MNPKTSVATTSVISVILSFFASSHHWLHMSVLLLLGGSTEVMAAMQGFLWLRRFMIIMTVATVFFSIYRLIRHRCKEKWVVGLTSFSALLSVGFVLYTLLDFGW